MIGAMMSAFMPLPSPVRRDGVFFLLSILAVGLFLLRAESLHKLGFPLDDAWIHQTYARNLADQGEWAFIAGQPSAASTAPLYSALLAIGHILNLSPFLWASILGVLALSLGAAMAARIGEQLFPQTRLVGWCTGLAVLLAWHLVWAAASGMETMLFMALSLMVIWLILHETPPQNYQTGLLLGILGGLLTLTRPDGVLLLGIIGLVTLLSVAPSNPKRYIFWAVIVGIGWLVVIAPYVIWNYDLTGDVLPATADAKIAEYAPLRETSLFTRYFRMTLPILVGAQILTLPGILAGIGLIVKRVPSDKRQLILLIPLLWAFLHLTIFVIRLPANY